jgi:response regulator of citrate/malate metabolism
MTGYGTPDLIKRALELGASGYILKPFTMDELMQHIEFYSKQKESGQFVRHEALMLSTAQ